MKREKIQLIQEIASQVSIAIANISQQTMYTCAVNKLNSKIPVIQVSNAKKLKVIIYIKLVDFGHRTIDSFFCIGDYIPSNRHMCRQLVHGLDDTVHLFVIPCFGIVNVTIGACSENRKLTSKQYIYICMPACIYWYYTKVCVGICTVCCMWTIGYKVVSECVLRSVQCYCYKFPCQVLLCC